MWLDIDILKQNLEWFTCSTSKLCTLGLLCVLFFFFNLIFIFVFVGAYKNHLFVLRLDLGPHDEIPDSFEEWASVEFNTPATTVSKTQVRSISVENPNPPEKWVRYIAKYEYRVQIDCQVETASDHEGSSD